MNMQERKQSRSAKGQPEEKLVTIGRMRVLDMHAHLASLSDNVETWEAQMRREELPGQTDALREQERSTWLGCRELELRKSCGIATCFSSGTMREWEYLQQFGEREEILRSFGIHPWYSAQEALENAMEAFRSCDMIGEIGMDSVWCEVPLELQRRKLEQQLQIAADFGKPVILHTKGQEREIADLLKGFPNPVCVHWYSGTMEDLERYLELDSYFTIGPDFADICRSQKERGTERQAVCRRIVSEVSLDRLFVETDGISAVAWAKNTEVLDWKVLSEVLEGNMEFLAACRQIPMEELRTVMDGNLRDFLSR